MDYRGTVWVADFGLAKAAGDELVLTQSGDIIGTLRYLPPERLDGKSDLRGDVYSLGVTLYELVTPRHAFPDVDRSVLMRRKLDAELPRPRRVNPGVPRTWKRSFSRRLPATRVIATRRRLGWRPTCGDLSRTAPSALAGSQPRRAALALVPARPAYCQLARGALGGTHGRASGRVDTVAAPSKRHATRHLLMPAPTWPRSRHCAELYLSNIAQARLEWRLTTLAAPNGCSPSA